MGPTPPADQFQIQNNYNFVDTLSWVKGAHSIRFGGEYTRVNLDKSFPKSLMVNYSSQPTADGDTDFQNFLESAHRSQLRRRRGLQSQVPQQQLWFLCAGRLEGPPRI